MFNRESLRTIVVALVMCLVCSILVSFVAVALKPMQLVNKELDRNTNILQASGLYKEGMSSDDVMAEFNHFEARIVDLSAGKFATSEQLQQFNIDPDTYDQYASAKNPKLSKSLGGDDPAGIGRLPDFAKVYIMKQSGTIKLIVLPISGYGLWSMLYGFIVLGEDLNTIKGLGFYQQGETPGLGGEVDNPKWKALWPGKKSYTQNGDVSISVVKGKAKNDQQIDGLSGATLTTSGVNNLIRFWLGERGFEKFITHLKEGEA